MRPIRHQDLRADAASKLEHIELAAALLERDATNNRHFIHGFTPAWNDVAGARRRPRFTRARKLFAGIGRAARAVYSVADAIARSRRLHAAVRHCWQFAVDLAIVLACSAALGAAVTLGVLVLAPPV